MSDIFLNSNKFDYSQRIMQEELENKDRHIEKLELIIFKIQNENSEEKLRKIPINDIEKFLRKEKLNKLNNGI